MKVIEGKFGDKTKEEKQRLKDLLAQKESQEKGFFFKK